MPTFPNSILEKGLAYAICFIFLYGVALGIYCGTKYLLHRLENKKPSTKQCDHHDHIICPTFEVYTTQDLCKHSVFGYIRLVRVMTIPNLPIPDVGRKAVFQDLLDNKFRIVGAQILDWLILNSNKINEMPGPVIASELLTLLAKIVAEYEREGQILGIPMEVIEKFRYWHRKRIEQLQEEIELVCQSEWISEAVHRVGFCLSVLEMVLRATILDAERTLVSLNGHLCGKTYKNLVLGAPKAKE
jgi:hypothetical protein